MKNNSGFTLIELSIVLLIISLITGGIASGRSLIHSSRLVDIIDDATKYQTSVRAFELEYHGLPGDLVNATDYWPGQTTNGNGDGYVGSPNEQEKLNVFQHMALGGVVEGRYQPEEQEQAIVLDGQYRTNPTSAFENRTFIVDTENRLYKFSQNVSVPHRKENTLSYSSIAEGDSLSSVDAHRIDEKLDDGLPGKGKITVGSQNLDCAVSHSYANMQTTTYDLSNRDIACEVFFSLE